MELAFANIEKDAYQQQQKFHFCYKEIFDVLMGSPLSLIMADSDAEYRIISY